MNYELIRAEEYDSLPEDDEQGFVQFEASCRASVNRLIDENSTTDFDRLVQPQYMAMISAAALESSVPDISMPGYDDEHFYEIYQ
jgi:hypothetical protein